MKTNKRFLRRLFIRIKFEFFEGARNASYVINNL
jgi:hypothetical protein